MGVLAKKKGVNCSAKWNDGLLDRVIDYVELLMISCWVVHFNNTSFAKALINGPT